MSNDPNNFVSESSTSEANSDVFFEVAVPNFATSTSTSGGSFVRLGAFPDLTTDASLAGLSNSMALANLVGDVVATAKIDSVPGGFTDGSGLGSPYAGTGDPNYLLGFADDTRLRAADAPGDTLSNPDTLLAGASVTNSAANRQKETLTLLTKGGWWDHSDGNRVTTTSGDKIEVIQGNYKLVVLGRQPLVPDPGPSALAKLAENAFITDVSGGHFQEQYPSPTPCIKTIEYSQDDDGEWTLYQDNGKGNLITKLSGRTVDLFEGSKREAYVGNATASTGTDPSNGTKMTLDPVIIAKTWARSTYAQTGSEDKPVGATGSVSTADWLASAFTAQQVDVVAGVAGNTSAESGDVVTKTWASRILNYTGSSATPVHKVYSETYALDVESFTFATSVISSTFAGSVFNTTTAASIVNTNIAANSMELLTGYKESLTIAGKLDINIGASMVVNATEVTETGPYKAAAYATQDSIVGLKNSLRQTATTCAIEMMMLALRATEASDEYTNISLSFSALATSINLG